MNGIYASQSCLFIHLLFIAVQLPFSVVDNKNTISVSGVISFEMYSATLFNHKPTLTQQ